MITNLKKPLLCVLCGACLVAAPEASAQVPAGAPEAGAPAARPGPVDPFLAGALGVIPFMSGFYITEKWERGVVFSLLDVLLVLGIFNSREGEQQDEDNYKVYYGLIAANNIVDALLSMRQASRKPMARLRLHPEGGVEAGLAWNF